VRKAIGSITEVANTITEVASNAAKAAQGAARPVSSPRPAQRIQTDLTGMDKIKVSTGKLPERSKNWAIALQRSVKS
jgi:hypothetical protein